MKRQVGIVALAVVSLVGVAGAQERTLGAGKGGDQQAVGVEFEERKGFFAEIGPGVFTAFGGRKLASNAQPFIALTAGTSIASIPGLTVFFTAAHGFNAGSCRDVVPGKAGADPTCQVYKTADNSTTKAPDSFSVIPLELGARYRFNDLVPRLKPYAGLTGGVSLLTPQITDKAPLFTPHVGLAGGVEYITRLEGLSVGAELMIRVGFSPMIPSFAGYPRISYIF